MLTNMTITAFAGRVAGQQPPPGGGSVAAVSAVLGCSLLEMVLQLIGEEQVLTERAAWQQELSELRQQLQQQVDADAAALAAILAIFTSGRSPHDAQPEVLAAAQIPLQTAALCQRMLEIGRAILPHLAAHLVGDALIGIFACHTGAVGSLLSTAANLPLLTDAALVQQLQAEAERIKGAVDTLRSTAEQLA